MYLYAALKDSVKNLYADLNPLIKQNKETA